MPPVILAYPSANVSGAPAARPLDPRARRDVQSRRIQRLAVRRVARAGGLLVLDSAAVLAGVLAVGLLGGVDVLAVMPLVAVVVVLCQAAFHTYGPSTKRRSGESLTVALAGATVLLAALDLYQPILAWTASQFVAFGIVAWFWLLCGRQAADRIVGWVYGRKVAIERVLVVGRWEDEWQVAEQFRLSGERGLAVVGHLDPHSRSGSKSAGTLDELSSVVEQRDVDRVVISARLAPERLRQIVTDCFLHGIGVSVVPATLASLECKVSSRSSAGWPMLELDVPRLHLLQLAAKRTVDLAGAIAGLLLLAPLFAALAVAVKLDSPGPVLFRQRRLGVGGRPFSILKFRSMRADAEQVLRADPALYQRYVENGFKLPPSEDPRISGFGSFLRRSSLDELPQLINVLLGDMSLVGPRPIVPDEIREYGAHAPTFLGVRPGVTGYWQISGRSDVGYPERAELDINYILQWSLRLDLKILVLTLPAVLGRRGAH